MGDEARSLTLTITNAGAWCRHWRDGSGVTWGRRTEDEGAVMSRISYCPYCQLPQQLAEHPPAVTGEVYCSNCGVPLPQPPDAAPSAATVLWIDDDPLLLGLCVGVLQRHGYQVLSATDGMTGIATAHQPRRDPPGCPHADDDRV